MKHTGAQLSPGKAEPQPPATCSAKLAFEHLTALNLIHGELLAALACKREATRTPIPDPIAICRARWDLSRVSRRHRALVDNILKDLLPGATPDALAIITVLRQQIIHQTQTTTRHIQAWTADRIIREWALFCAEAAAIQADLERRAEVEKKSIEPILLARASKTYAIRAGG